MSPGVRQESLILEGPVGSIEAVLTLPAEVRWLAVIAHPHPLYGGTMDNRVVMETADCLVQQGAAALRFNFRGVGASSGRHDGGVGERLDLEAAVGDARRRFPDLPCLLAGYSFGCYVALGWASRATELRPPPVQGLLALAPPVDAYDFSFMETVVAPVAILCGALDSLTPPERTRAQLEAWPRVVRLDFLAGAGHDLGSAGARVESLRASLKQAVRSLYSAVRGDDSPEDQSIDSIGSPGS